MQISLSGDNIDRYFRILEHYVLPLMVVSTIVLFCGYVASRIYHRTTARGGDEGNGAADRDDMDASPFDGTAAFLRELRATPPIEDDEPKREPRMRAHHPLLRRRAANAAAALRARPDAPEDRQPAPQPAAQPDPMPAAAPEPPAAHRLDLPQQAPSEQPWPERAPPPRFDPPGMFEPDPAPQFREARREAPAQPRGPAEDVLRRTTDDGDVPSHAGRRRSRRDLFAESGLRGERPEQELPQRTVEDRAPDHVTDRAPDRAKLDPPPVTMTSNWWQDSDEPARTEPSAAVVQPLKAPAPPSSADLESARVRAGEVSDSLDHAASVLQQSATLLAERMQHKHGLELGDVRSMRIAGFAEPQGNEEDLRKFGGDVAQEAVSAIDAVARFDNVLRRLEQMAEAEPLDEGWNDLLRTRISDTLYQIGQVRKTLGGYRVAAKKPARSSDRSSDKHARPGSTSGGGPDRPVPVGRRQV